VTGVTELGVVGQGELVELGLQVVVAVLDPGVDVVERALDQVALVVGLEVDHVGLGQARAAAAERDDFQIGFVAVVGELGQQGVEVRVEFSVGRHCSEPVTPRRFWSYCRRP
jgi:hypothetical protein